MLGEYSAYYQINWNWAIYYSIMPISLSGTTIANRSFYLGNWSVAPGNQIHTEWNFIYQRLGLCTPLLTLVTPLYQSTQLGYIIPSNLRFLVPFALIGPPVDLTETDKCLCRVSISENAFGHFVTVGTLSCDTKVSIGYLDNTLALDIQPGMRFSVPLNCGRWGFIKGGYRWLNFDENRNDLKMNVYLEGGFAEAGLIF